MSMTLIIDLKHVILWKSYSEKCNVKEREI